MRETACRVGPVLAAAEVEGDVDRRQPGADHQHRLLVVGTVEAPLQPRIPHVDTRLEQLLGNRDRVAARQGAECEHHPIGGDALAAGQGQLEA